MLEGTPNALVTETTIEVRNFMGTTKLKEEKAGYEKTAEADLQKFGPWKLNDSPIVPEVFRGPHESWRCTLSRTFEEGFPGCKNKQK